MSQKDRIVRRIQAKAIWKLESVAHFGGEDGDDADMTLLRDSRGVVYIPGTSIAGVARAYLARCLQSHADFLCGEEPRVLEALFGGAYRRGDEGTMSALSIEDGLFCNEKGKSLVATGEGMDTSLRDGVRLDGVTGVAADTAKYDVEVLEPEAFFLLCFTLLVREEPIPQDDSKKRKVTHEELLCAFDRLLAAFEKGEIALGAKTRRGYGRGSVSKQGDGAWKIADLSMSDTQGILAWLRRTSEKTVDRATFSKKLNASSLSPDMRRAFSLEADFEIPDALLIRSVLEKPDSADVSHLHAGGQPIISGTSWAGVLRHQAEKILLSLGYDAERTQNALCRLFGSLHQGELPRRTQKVPLVASRLRVEESQVTEAKGLVVQTRVAIDRFTGGAADTALFEEEPLRGREGSAAKTSLRLHLEEPCDGEVGLLCLLLKDLWYGLAPVGGTVSVGRGHLRGVGATLTLKDPEPEKGVIWKFTRPQGKEQMQATSSEQPPLGSYVDKINQWIVGDTASIKENAQSTTLP